jgi:hypothetical protein
MSLGAPVFLPATGYCRTCEVWYSPVFGASPPHEFHDVVVEDEGALVPRDLLRTPLPFLPYGSEYLGLPS